MSAATGPWVRRFHPAEDAPVRLACFPHAGGSASSYLALSRELSPALDVLAVQYPGRQDRVSEPPPSSVDGYADPIADVLRSWCDRPLVLFGHSMGALIAFETARRLEAGGVRPAHLFASACPPPRTDRSGRRELTDDASVLAEVRRLGGTPAAALDEPEIVDAMLPTLRSDFAVVDGYRYDGPDRVLSCPVTALVGDADPDVDGSRAQPWEEITGGAFALHRFDGDHFYLTGHVHAVARLVASCSGAAVTAPRAG